MPPVSTSLQGRLPAPQLPRPTGPQGPVFLTAARTEPRGSCAEPSAEPLGLSRSRERTEPPVLSLIRPTKLTVSSETAPPRFPVAGPSGSDGSMCTCSRGITAIPTHIRAACCDEIHS